MGIPAGDVLVDALVVPATGDDMGLVHTTLKNVWPNLCQRRPLADAWYDAFVLAVAEVASNIIQYALLKIYTPDRLIAHLADRATATPHLHETIMPPVPSSHDPNQISA